MGGNGGNGGKWGKWGEMGGDGGKWGGTGENGRKWGIVTNISWKMYENVPRRKENGEKWRGEWVKNGTCSGNFPIFPGPIFRRADKGLFRGPLQKFSVQVSSGKVVHVIPTQPSKYLVMGTSGAYVLVCSGRSGLRVVTSGGKMRPRLPTCGLPHTKVWSGHVCSRRTGLCGPGRLPPARPWAPKKAMVQSLAGLVCSRHKACMSPYPQLKGPHKAWVSPHPQLKGPHKAWVSPYPQLKGPHKAWVSPYPQLKGPHKAWMSQQRHATTPSSL